MKLRWLALSVLIGTLMLTAHWAAAQMTDHSPQALVSLVCRDEAELVAAQRWRVPV
jgi:hypothetical protein